LGVGGVDLDLDPGGDGVRPAAGHDAGLLGHRGGVGQDTVCPSWPADRRHHPDQPDGEPGLKHLCLGYTAFFHHIDRPTRMMAGLLRQGRAPH
jgi:hypothetical protein